jgi:hypothetical protein
MGYLTKSFVLPNHCYISVTLIGYKILTSLIMFVYKSYTFSQKMFKQRESDASRYIFKSRGDLELSDGP